MNIGKLNNQQLNQLVFKHLPPLDSQVIMGAAIGGDCAWLNCYPNLIVTSSDPITAGGMNSGRLAIHVSCNDIASSGLKPLGILLVVIVPPHTSESDLEYLIADASQAAAEVGVSIIGGHTEVSNAVNDFVVVTTAIGVVTPGNLIPRGKAQLGDSLLVTKTAGIEGTWIILHQKMAALIEELQLDASFIKKMTQDLQKQLSVLSEGVLANSIARADGLKSPEGFSHSIVNLMHDVTEGGILGGAYEMAELSGLGIEIDLTKIPIHPVSQKLSDFFHLDIFRLISSGSMLISTHEPEKVLEKLTQAQIQCTIIGKFIPQGFYQKDKTGTKSILLPPQADELYKVF